MLNAIVPPKKAKKPTDGWSYAELVLQPFAAYASIKITPFDGEVYGNLRRINKQLKLPVYGGASELSVTVTGVIPSSSELHPLQIALGGVHIGGNLSNI